MAATISDATKRKILQLYAKGTLPATKIAKIYGVSPESVRNIVKGKGVHEEVLMTVQEQKAQAAAEVREIAARARGFMTDELMQTASFIELVNGHNNLLKTADVLDGTPTPDAVALSGKTPEEVAALQASAMAKLAGLGVLQNQHTVEDGSDA